MSRKRIGFTQAQIRRAVQAARSAGLAPSTVEVRPDGSILISEAATTTVKKSPLDEWLEQNGSRAP
jgi:hypothetical protein